MIHYFDNVQDQYGNAVSGIVVKAYLTGTTTVTTIYSDDGITPITGNFVTTDANGSFSFYIANGNYDLVGLLGTTEKFRRTNVALDIFSAVDVSNSTVISTGSTNARSLANRFAETLNVKDFGAVAGGVTNDAAAFNAVWTAVAATEVNPSANSTYVTKRIIIPPGVYKIGTSIDWTNLSSWNVTVEAYGAVFLGDVIGGNVIDMLGDLGITVKGLTIYGNATNPPTCAILVGPIGTATCGINSFEDCKFIGYYTKAAFWNIGSETTQYIGCRFSNSYIGASAYAYLADGLNRFGASSIYQSVRAPNTAVSFTNNTFNHCSIRNWATSNSGASIYLEQTVGWSFDKGCYFLAFTGPNVRIRNEAATPTYGLSLKGLFETSQAPGLDYCVEYLVTAATAGVTYDNDFDFTYPMPKTAIIKLSEPSGGTPGTLQWLGTTRIINSSLGAITLFSAAQMTYIGDLHCKAATTINLANLAAFKGVLYTDTLTNISQPVGVDTNNMVVFDNASGNLSFISKDPVFYSMSNAETGGSFTFSRYLGQADRSSKMAFFNSATAGNNYIKFQVHNGTVGTRVDVLTARGDSHVYVGDIATQNILNLGASATGSGPTVIVSGIDTNTNLIVASKGTGDILFYSAQGADIGFAINGVASSVNYLRANPGATGTSPALEAQGADADLNLQLTPKGTGNLFVPIGSVRNAANDAAAAALTPPVPVGGVYRNGSVLMIRVA